jgi:CheY-like chemotaxis protein
MLAHSGYEPLAVAGGGEAVALCRARPSGIAAAVLDVQMPGIDGPTALDALRALDSGLPCVFLTGAAAGYSEADLLARGACAVLPKPVSLADLRRAVAAAIGTRRSTGPEHHRAAPHGDGDTAGG